MGNAPARYRARVGILAIAMAALSSPGAGAADWNVQIDGRQVRLTTERWTATLDAGLVVALTNRLTGEVYAQPGKGAPERVPAGLGVQTGAVEEARELHAQWGSGRLQRGARDLNASFPSQHRPYAGSRVTITQPDAHTVTMAYRGLAAGARQYPRETFELTARFDRASGELILTSSGQCDDGGVYGSAVGAVSASSNRPIPKRPGSRGSWPTTRIAKGSSTGWPIARDTSCSGPTAESFTGARCACPASRRSCRSGAGPPTTPKAPSVWILVGSTASFPAPATRPGCKSIGFPAA